MWSSAVWWDLALKETGKAVPSWGSRFCEENQDGTKANLKLRQRPL
jgi:hypothetical protein